LKDSFTLGVCVYGASGLTNDQGLCVTAGQTIGRSWSWRKFKYIDKTERVNGLFEELSDIFTVDEDIQVIGFPEDFPLHSPLGF
jgi:hypothetical protein